MLIYIVVLLAGGVLSGYFFFRYLNAKKSMSYSHEADGAIEQIRSSRLSGQLLSYKLAVSYTVSGKSFKTYMKISGTECPYSKGDKLKLVYDPQKPQLSRIIADKRMIFSAYTKYIFALVALAVAMLLISYLQPTACHAENYTLALLLTYLGISNLHDEFYILNYPAAADGHISSVTPINNAAQIQITYNIGNAFFVARMDRPVSDIDKYSIDSPVKLIYHSKKPFIAKTDSSKKYYIISVITLLFALMFSAFMIFEALM